MYYRYKSRVAYAPFPGIKKQSNNHQTCPSFLLRQRLLSNMNYSYCLPIKVALVLPRRNAKNSTPQPEPPRDYPRRILYLTIQTELPKQTSLNPWFH